LVFHSSSIAMMHGPINIRCRTCVAARCEGNIDWGTVQCMNLREAAIQCTFQYHIRQNVLRERSYRPHSWNWFGQVSAGTVQRYTERLLLLLQASNNLTVTLGSTNGIANHAVASN